jgi:hypothetical protein
MHAYIEGIRILNLNLNLNLLTPRPASVIGGPPSRALHLGDHSHGARSVGNRLGQGCHTVLTFLTGSRLKRSYT